MSGYTEIPNAKWDDTGRQVILKSDWIAVETALLQSPELKNAPHLSWVDVTSVKVAATADCISQLLMNGFPNILHPGSYISGGLSDGKYRANTSDTSMDFDVSSSFWGTEKVSQYYGIYGIAGDADTTWTLKAMPWMRVKSQATQTISMGTLTTPATGIGYGFVIDEFIDAKILFISGSSKGLIRTISANNNDNSTGGTITYSGDAVTVAAGDWFIILPDINFRWIGDIFNNASGNIENFDRMGNQVNWLGSVAINGGYSAVVEDVRCASPLACAIGVTSLIESVTIRHPNGSTPMGISSNIYAPIINLPATQGGGVVTLSSDGTQSITSGEAINYGFGQVSIINCKYWANSGGGSLFSIFYEYPQGYL